MKIQGSSEANGGKTSFQPNRQQEQDSQLKAIQSQIDNVQKQLKNLNDDKEVTAEEKMSKRKELQEELQSLNNQMMQRKIEIQKEKREAAAEALRQEAEKTAATKNPDGNTNKSTDSMSSKTVEGLVAADSTMKQVDVTQRIKTKLEGTNRVLDSEIAIDKSRGMDTSSKQKEVDKNKDLIQNIMEDLGEKINEASERIENGMTADQIEQKAADEKEKDEAQNGKNEVAGNGEKKVVNLEKGQYIDEYL